jgi:hypothetical protein
MRALGLAILVISLAAGSSPLDAALCKNRKGAVFSRDTCKRKEVEIDLAAIGAAGAKGDPGPAGTGQPRLDAVDASGQRLPGVLTGRGTLVYAVGGRLISFNPRPAGFSGANFFFDAMNCVGPRLVKVTDNLYDDAAILGTVAYYAGDPVQNHSIQSEAFPSTPQECTGVGRTYDAGTGLCCVDAFTDSISAGLATPVPLGAFTSPLRVEVEE